jgi:hypothetical protein
MGLESAEGFLKLDLSNSIEGWAVKGDAANAMESAAVKRACGNLEDKGAMVWITPVCW